LRIFSLAQPAVPWNRLQGVVFLSQTPEELGRKIKEAQERQGLETRARVPQGSGNSGAMRALRAGVDMVAPVAVGSAIGYEIDKFAGTKPLFMIVLLFLGFFAGVLNIIRAERRQDFGVGWPKAPDTGSQPPKKENEDDE
jgi:ATP synthase protein I